MKLRLITAAAAALLALAGAANAEEHIVQLLTKGDKGSMVFQPNFIKAALGDTVKFVPGDKTHNVETIQGMIPDGAQEFKGKVGETITVTLTQEGVYGVKCNPHYGLGMVALIVIGKPVNLDAAQAVKQVGKARTVFPDLFSQVTKAN
ncbi:pseudoazurin [Mesorhizobium amorphae]|uniref:pseudoazurin n=1 Tax=Mesorhizobium amorphae TaxID=71433 RepID=UPI0017850406|nr:pseudoazurin [Mesorhizobium amorphae]